jgi:hypothetical protein
MKKGNFNSKLTLGGLDASSSCRCSGKSTDSAKELAVEKLFIVDWS